MKLPFVPSAPLNRPLLLRAGAGLLIVLWLAGSGFWLADDIVAQRNATPEEALVLRWHLGTTKPEPGKIDPPKPEQPPAKSQNINDLFSVRKGGVDSFDPLSRNTPANAPIMVADWPRRILAGAAIALARDIGEQMLRRRPIDIDGATDFAVKMILGGVPALPTLKP